MKAAQAVGSWLLGAGVVAAVIFGAIMLVRYMDREDARWDRAQKQAFARANTICGSPPAAVKWHGSGWSNGPFVEVTCPDRTVRIIKP